jgi:hypothetical protein
MVINLKLIGHKKNYDDGPSISETSRPYFGSWSTKIILFHNFQGTRDAELQGHEKNRL